MAFEQDFPILPDDEKLALVQGFFDKELSISQLPENTCGHIDSFEIRCFFQATVKCIDCKKIFCNTHLKFHRKVFSETLQEFIHLCVPYNYTFYKKSLRIKGYECQKDTSKIKISDPYIFKQIGMSLSIENLLLMTRRNSNYYIVSEYVNINSNVKDTGGEQYFKCVEDYKKFHQDDYYASLHTVSK